jgi:peptidoglycan hydrolase-like amidase
VFSRYRISMASVRFFSGFLLLSQISLPAEPTVRIGIHQNISSFSVRSSEPFMLEGARTRSAEFSIVIAIGEREGTYSKSDLKPRMAIEIDADTIVIRSLDSTLRVVPGGSPIQVEDRTYRGEVEIFGNSRGSITVVNELPLEQYLRGVVPNELAPDAFPELEALKAQAIAARTYIVRNLGQFENENFDICATDFCQVYRGLGTEHPLSDEAVEQTRGMIATFEGEAINALYSSTCGGRTENAENVFSQKVPYLVSTICHYRHPEPQPFETSVMYGSWEEGLLGIAGVESFSDAGRFLGIPDLEEPTSMDPEVLAPFIRTNFFPKVVVQSDLDFLREQGVLLSEGPERVRDVLLHLIEKKNAFEWQAARLMSWDGEKLNVRIGQEIQELQLNPDVAVFRRMGDERIPVDQGAWLGGESFDLRVVDGFVEALVYRPNLGSLSADRYSPLVRWQTHRTRRELDAAIRSLNIGLLEDIRVLARGLSERVVRVEIRGTNGRSEISGSRLRTLLGLRDTMVYIDEERNRRRELLGMSFYGGGWGHGVGMCQVGAYGMAIDGAGAEDILKTYYRGIELTEVY